MKGRLVVKDGQIASLTKLTTNAQTLKIKEFIWTLLFFYRKNHTQDKLIKKSVVLIKFRKV